MDNIDQNTNEADWSVVAPMENTVTEHDRPQVGENTMDERTDTVDKEDEVATNERTETTDKEDGVTENNAESEAGPSRTRTRDKYV